MELAKEQQVCTSDNWYQQIGNRVYQLTDTYPVFRLAGHTKWYQQFLNALLVPTTPPSGPLFTAESGALRHSLDCSYCERLFNRYGNMVAITDEGVPISLVFGAAEDNPNNIDPLIVAADAVLREAVEAAARKAGGLSNFVIPGEVYGLNYTEQLNSEYRIIGTVDPIGGFSHVRMLWSHNRARAFHSAAMDAKKQHIAARPALLDWSVMKSITNTFTQVFANPGWSDQLDKLLVKFDEVYGQRYPEIYGTLRVFSAYLRTVYDTTRLEHRPSTEMVVWHYLADPVFYRALSGIRQTLFGAVVIDRYLTRPEADLEKALAEVVEWRSPENYMQGNTKLVDKAEMLAAGKALEEAGVLDSLYRRVATVEEVLEHFADLLIWQKTVVEEPKKVLNAFEQIAEDLDKPNLPVKEPFNQRASMKHITLSAFLAILAEKKPERLWALARPQEMWGFWHTTDAEDPKAISSVQRTAKEPVQAVFISPLETNKTYTFGVEHPDLSTHLDDATKAYHYIHSIGGQRHYVEVACITQATWNGRIEETEMDLEESLTITIASNLNGIVAPGIREKFIEENTGMINQPLSPAPLVPELRKHRRGIQKFAECNKMSVAPGIPWLLSNSYEDGAVRVFIFNHAGVTLSYAVHFVQ